MMLGSVHLVNTNDNSIEDPGQHTSEEHPLYARGHKQGHMWSTHSLALLAADL